MAVHSRSFHGTNVTSTSPSNYVRWSNLP
uniref:Uncharacterized protein n=1 Tax=Anguilla anguilla TaxID=7936 RepID=A0A0E9PBU4_ANGAN